MKDFEPIHEIKTPDTWKYAAKALWHGQKKRRGVRCLRPALIAAAVLCLLGGIPALAVQLGLTFQNGVIVSTLEEMWTLNDEREASQDAGEETEAVVVYDKPNENQPSVEELVESAAVRAENWQSWYGADGAPIGMEPRPAWDSMTVDVMEGELWQRRFFSQDGWTKTEYTAESPMRLMALETPCVHMDVGWLCEQYACIPFGNFFYTITDDGDELRGVSYLACYTSEAGQYISMEYSWHANGADWGLDYVIEEFYDEVETYTATNGLEFLIETYNDALWAYCNTEYFMFSVYARNVGMAEAEAILDSLDLTVLSE